MFYLAHCMGLLERTKMLDELECSMVSHRRRLEERLVHFLFPPRSKHFFFPLVLVTLSYIDFYDDLAILYFPSLDIGRLLYYFISVFIKRSLPSFPEDRESCIDMFGPDRYSVWVGIPGKFLLPFRNLLSGSCRKHYNIMLSGWQLLLGHKVNLMRHHAAECYCTPRHLTHDHRALYYSSNMRKPVLPVRL
jgi:hypothetical protein